MNKQGPKKSKTQGEREDREKDEQKDIQVRENRRKESEVTFLYV
jgi:hypothetical protein